MCHAQDGFTFKEQKSWIIPNTHRVRTSLQIIERVLQWFNRFLYVPDTITTEQRQKTGCHMAACLIFRTGTWEELRNYFRGSIPIAAHSSREGPYTPGTARPACRINIVS